jgi:superfamily II RNA helicase
LTKILAFSSKAKWLVRYSTHQYDTIMIMLMVLQIHSADELVLTELILENVLADFEPAEIVALLSAFVFQEKTDISQHSRQAWKGVKILSSASPKGQHFPDTASSYPLK